MTWVCLTCGCELAGEELPACEEHGREPVAREFPATEASGVRLWWRVEWAAEESDDLPCDLY